MRTMHGIFDVNNDGVISFDDFVILADKFGDLGHLSEQEMEEFRGVMKVRFKFNLSDSQFKSNDQSLILVNMGIKLG